MERRGRMSAALIVSGAGAALAAVLVCRLRAQRRATEDRRVRSTLDSTTRVCVVNDQESQRSAVVEAPLPIAGAGTSEKASLVNSAGEEANGKVSGNQSGSTKPISPLPEPPRAAAAVEPVAWRTPDGVGAGSTKPDSSKGKENTSKADTWVVKGGAESGGILVRAGPDLKSRAEPLRLQTGAKIQLLQRQGDRLQYSLLHGEGPKTGWVSRCTKEKELVVPA
mmetsp:Transcript_31964/g.58518  ORF Transcript_31964/g.58518 Transcript_31964/m.58518 type:complete len:223 (-) Transcript_31964:154-822(-)